MTTTEITIIKMIGIEDMSETTAKTTVVQLIKKIITVVDHARTTEIIEIRRTKKILQQNQKEETSTGMMIID